MLMIPCPVCGDALRGDRETVGARCPTCREPLYEQPRDPRLGTGGGRCVAHPGNGAVGTCQRCGDYLCGVCWTRWQDKSVCARCVQRALEANEAAPAETRAHLRQAVLAVVFGLAAWGITVVAFLMMMAGMAGEINAILVGFGVIVLLGTPLPSIAGIGQGAAAIRTRGDHMIMATIGLLLSALHTGLIVGMFTFTIWES